jgi:hypothetical protein
MRFGYYDRLSREQKRIYDASDSVKAIRIHDYKELWPLVDALKAALKKGTRSAVESASSELLDAMCDRFEVDHVKLQVLATRPSSEESELHGLYTLRPRKALIQVWMKTAKLGRVVAFRTFLRTLLHELCHHLDFTLLNLPVSFHTQGFYQRESSLFHQLVP